ncbi:ABC transporter C family member 10-like [Senna tora]|uniref:ABC-type xenobiotic transporter n=1 Tax=Senna tora TaxID=362788 RepID=A0A834SYG3_9FABA|nr:ABC transporter C family member 10-like [Senna tora]
MDDFWSKFCGESSCSSLEGKSCSYYDLKLLGDPSSCINHLFIICLDLLLLFILLSFMIMIQKKPFQVQRYYYYSTLQVASAIVNSCLGVVHLCFGIWILEENLRVSHTMLPLNWWLLELFHGFSWLTVGLTLSLRSKRLPRTRSRLFAVLVFIISGVFCALSIMFYSFSDTKFSLKVALDALSFLGAILLLLYTFKEEHYYKHEESHDEGLYIYTPLNNNVDSISYENPFSKAGFFNRISFWWLNPLMKRGKEKTLQDEDIPKLPEEDQAQSCYLEFLDQLNKQKQKQKEATHSLQPLILKTIILCHWREILISGFYALMKILTLSSGPLLLNSFILVAEGKESFKHEAYVLTILLFCIKIIESFSERQWFFWTRVIGLRVRSLLTAAIYKKQLRLSSASKLMHSGGEIMNYVTVDAYRVGEFPYWFHQIWTTIVQLCIAIVIIFQAIKLATIASLVVILLTVLLNTPLAKLQNKFLSQLMVAQDERLKAISEALGNMKVLKLYAWENHFKKGIEKLRKVELNYLLAAQASKAYNIVLFWCSPVLVSTASFVACYFLNVPLHANNVFTYVAILRILQEPIRVIPDVIGVMIQAKVSFERIVRFLEAEELETGGGGSEKKKRLLFNNDSSSVHGSVLIKNGEFSWDGNTSKETLRNIDLEVKCGEKVAICGEVGSGKSTLLAAILGEVPPTQGTIKVHGKFAYVSQTAWIQTGTIRDNILFGSAMDAQRYQETIQSSSLVKDLEMLPHGDLTEIGERGVNLSGGQKQRIQLARSLYQNADIYLLDDPFSAVDAHTATNLFNEYVMKGLSGKTVLLVTHQVDFLPAFDSILLMSDGEILQSAPYHQLLTSSQEFQDLVNAHKETAGSDSLVDPASFKRHADSDREIRKANNVVTDDDPFKETTKSDQLIKQEERERGDNGFKPYLLYLNQNKGYIYFCVAALSHLTFVICQILQNSWMALNVDNSHVSSDLSIVDLDIPWILILGVGTTTVCYGNLTVLAVITWLVLFVLIPMVCITIHLQRYYLASAKELMRMNGTTKSFVANHLAESIAGAVTIRAFEEEDRFFAKNLQVIDVNASPLFHSFAANEWLIQRLETLCALLLTSTAFCMAILPPGTFSSGIVGMALSYGLSLNAAFVFSIQQQCTISNSIISVERLNQYMHIPSEAPEVIEGNRPPVNWPDAGKVELKDLQIKYRANAPLVLRGITCTIEGGHKIGIVGRTGSGRSTLIGALFRLVEAAGGKIIVDAIDISSIGLHDLRSRFGIIPQDPTLFNGTVRYNLDPLSQHSDQEIWEVLGRYQLLEAIQEKEKGLDSSVVEDGSNWSMGQRQLFCLGRALLRRSRILVLDEATASIDNATDLILQKTIKSEFENCTVITVAHRIPTVMDCDMILALSDGKLVEYDEPMKLMKEEGSLFGQLVKEYWSHFHSAESH